MKLLEVEGGGHVPQCLIAGDTTAREYGSISYVKVIMVIGSRSRS